VRMTYTARGQYISLRGAEIEFGVERHTLREWLSRDLGLELPKVVRGSKFLILREDVLRCIALHCPRVAPVNGECQLVNDGCAS